MINFDSIKMQGTNLKKKMINISEQDFKDLGKFEWRVQLQRN